MYIPEPYKNTNIEQAKRFIQENSFGNLILKNTKETPDVRDSVTEDEADKGPTVNLQEKRKVLARPLPFEFDMDSNHYNDGIEFKTLTAHLGRHYPLYKCFNDGDEALITFQGPESYISPTWYDNLEAATWNYIHIQVYGTIERLDTKEFAQREITKYEDLLAKHPGNEGYERLLGMAIKKKELIRKGGCPDLEALLKVQLYKYEKKLLTDPMLSIERLGDRFQYLKTYIGAIRVNVKDVKVDVQSAFKLSQDQTDWSKNNIIKNLKATGYPGAVGVANEMEKRN